MDPGQLSPVCKHRAILTVGAVRSTVARGLALVGAEWSMLAIKTHVLWPFIFCAEFEGQGSERSIGCQVAFSIGGVEGNAVLTL